MKKSPLRMRLAKMSPSGSLPGCIGPTRLVPVLLELILLGSALPTCRKEPTAASSKKLAFAAIAAESRASDSLSAARWRATWRGFYLEAS